MNEWVDTPENHRGKSDGGGQGLIRIWIPGNSFVSLRGKNLTGPQRHSAVLPAHSLRKCFHPMCDVHQKQLGLCIASDTSDPTPGVCLLDPPIWEAGSSVR